MTQYCRQQHSTVQKKKMYLMGVVGVRRGDWNRDRGRGGDSKGFGGASSRGVVLQRHPHCFLGRNLLFPLVSCILLIILSRGILPRVQPATISNIVTNALAVVAKIRQSFILYCQRKCKAFTFYHYLIINILRKIQV